MKMNYFNQRDNGIEWNRFIIENNGSFLQSFEWGEFQKKFGEKIWRIEIKNGQEILLRAQIIQRRIKFKTYFYIPYGPVLREDIPARIKQEIFNLFFNEISKLARKENAIFLRIEPVYDISDFQKFRARDLTERIQPRKTLILDLKKTEDQIFNNFNKRTKYNIRLAQRKGVEARVLDQYSKIFYELMDKTKHRQGFRSHAEGRYKKLLDMETKDFRTRLFLAECDNKIGVASIVVFFGKRAVSLHMASDYEYRAKKMPDFLHWRKILFAKKAGYKEYDICRI